MNQPYDESGGGECLDSRSPLVNKLLIQNDYVTLTIKTSVYKIYNSLSLLTIGPVSNIDVSFTCVYKAKK